MAIQAGDNPKHIEERLNAYICEKKRMEAGGRGQASPQSEPSTPKEKKSRRKKK